MSGWANSDWAQYRLRGEVIEQTALRLGREVEAARKLTANLEAENETLRTQVAAVREACHSDSFAVDDTYRLGYATAQRGILRVLDGGET
jgi:hypothetical protein